GRPAETVRSRPPAGTIIGGGPCFSPGSRGLQLWAPGPLCSGPGVQVAVAGRGPARGGPLALRSSAACTSAECLRGPNLAAERWSRSDSSQRGKCPIATRSSDRCRLPAGPALWRRPADPPTRLPRLARRPTCLAAPAASLLRAVGSDRLGDGDGIVLRGIGLAVRAGREE